jgi:hypothetical protein
LAEKFGGQLKAKMGNFGVYQKDTSILARLIIPNHNKHGCEAWRWDDFENLTENHGKGFFIMM